MSEQKMTNDALADLANYVEQIALEYEYGSYPAEMLYKAAAALRAAVVPEGFVLVREKPKPQVLQAMVSELPSNQDTAGALVLARAMYAAMLAASQQTVPSDGAIYSEVSRRSDPAKHDAIIDSMVSMLDSNLPTSK